MAFHILHVKCLDCGAVNTFRRPHETLLVKILPHLPCHHCNPDALDHVCASCRFPWSHVPHHSNGMCTTCNISMWRYRRLTLQKAALA